MAFITLAHISLSKEGAWSSLMLTGVETEKENLRFTNNYNLPGFRKLNHSKQTLPGRFCLQEFYWGCSKNSSCEGAWKTGWRRGKR